MDIGTILGFIFTLLIFSYLLGDNFLYRLAVYVFVGVAAAFTTVIAFESVILPLLGSAGEIVLLGVALLLVLILTLRTSRAFQRFTVLTSLPLAFLIAVGAAVAVAGAITGTIIPLVTATGQGIGGEDIINGVIVIVGVITSLMYFQYAARQTPSGVPRNSRVIGALRGVGLGFIVITLGTIYGAAILTSLTILTERISFLTTIGG